MNWPMFEFGPRTMPFQMRWHIRYPFTRPYRMRFRTLILYAMSDKWDPYDQQHGFDRKAMGYRKTFGIWWQFRVKRC